MKYVADASYIAALLLPDERVEGLDVDRKTLFSKGVTCPGLLQLEVANILLKSERRKRIDGDQVRELSAIFDAFPIVLQPTLTNEQRHVVVNLARHHKLTSYDASYLELTIRLELEIVSLDDGLIEAAKREGVMVHSSEDRN